VVTVGRFEERKGHDMLLGAFEKLLVRRPQARLWMIGGEGRDLESTRARAAALGDRVSFFVNIPHAQVIPTLAEAHVFAFSSRWRKGEMGEGLPIAVLEAGALGLPVVTTRCCGAEEVIEDGKSGLLVKLEDEAALAEGMEKLLADRRGALQMGAALQQRVMNEFQWGRAWRSYRELAA
jgi:glycosyltransferase involved in cell wall biosynthesis